MASHNHLHFGQDIVWTYGPLGRLQVLAPLYRREWVEALLATTAIHAALIAALAALLIVRRASFVGWLLVTVVVLAPSAILPDRATFSLLSVEYELELLALVLLLLVASAPVLRARRGLAAAGGACLGAAALVKQIDLAVAVLTLLVAAGLTWRTPAMRRPMAVASAAATVTIGVLWFGSGQGAADVVPYVRGTLSLSTGYRAAQSFGDLPSTFFVAVFLLLAVVFFGVVLTRRRAPTAALACFLSLPLLIVNLEEAYVRNDTAHGEIFTSLMALVAAVVGIEALTARPGPDRGWLTGWVERLAPVPVVMLNCGLLLASGSPALATAPNRLGHWPQAITDVASSASWAADQKALGEHIEASYAVRPDMVARMVGGSVDVLPWNIDLVWALGLRWDPRPVLGSYSAYDPYLDGIDAAHILGPGRPDRLIFRTGTPGTIDGRYGAFDEPLTLRAILRAYTVEADSIASTGSGDFLLLHARPAPVSEERREEGTVCRPAGSRIAVPQVSGRLVFADLHFGYTRHGDLSRLVLTPGFPVIRFETDTGVLSDPFRWVQAQGASGLVVNAAITADSEFAALLRGQIVHPFDAFVVDSSSPADFESSVCATFWSTPLVKG